jgi:cysteine desulfurase
MARAYLDYNATAPLRPEARAAMLAALEVTGNASSVHSEGRAARKLIEEAREKVAALMQARPQDVVFTSGATEAANWLLTANAPRHQNKAPMARLLVGATEHTCVLDGHRFPRDKVEVIPVDANGLIDADALGARVAELTAEFGPASVAVAVQAANNETGVLQPIQDIYRHVDPTGAMLIVDAAQYAGKLPLELDTVRGDAVILSSHKLGGPQGAGAVSLGGDYFWPEPLMRGGGQERRRRAGTENVVAITGFAAAAEAAFAEVDAFGARVGALRDRLETTIRESRPDAVIFGTAAPRLPNTSCFAIPGLSAETALIALDLAGVAVSSGSACSSGKVAQSHVLAAMGVAPALAKGAIRISLGWASTEADLDLFATAWRAVLSHVAPGKIQAA